MPYSRVSLLLLPLKPRVLPFKTQNCPGYTLIQSKLQNPNNLMNFTPDVHYRASYGYRWLENPA